MHERAKWIPSPAPEGVLAPHPQSDVPAIPWIRERKAAFRVFKRSLQKRSVCGIAAYDTVEGHDGCGAEVARDRKEITMDESSGRGPLAAHRLPRRRGEIRR